MKEVSFITIRECKKTSYSTFTTLKLLHSSKIMDMYLNRPVMLLAVSLLFYSAKKEQHSAVHTESHGFPLSALLFVSILEHIGTLTPP